ncbi:YlqD family protein [Metabacillus fastidiosus]|uniref:YlqD family protein n=1 Tax=Metabacillus fastidiosus TaxID=1458 RepID=A0ABU6NWR7_9BACI|nr:YlqD family protein [Metabacillus fastidiosus]MED4401555.1 YlqD family protein [Metabacillus fastidiosus]MED4463190.1 YlqD family protein [Metabacillus fastidiosus]
MKILQRVSIKQVITEKSKEQLVTQFKKRKQQLERERDQLYFELKKINKTKKNPDIRAKYTKEIEKRYEDIKNIQFQLEQVHILPLGTEIKEKEIDAIIEVNEGDNWDELIKEKTIVIKDGIVEQIR